MKVLVDTSVWSLVLRRRAPDASLEKALGELVDEGRVLVIGPVRQEILSGVREEAQFETLRLVLAAFPDLPLETRHYEQAARFFKACRRSGIQGAHIDLLICAVSQLEHAPVFTADRDFDRYAEHLGVRLYRP